MGVDRTVPKPRKRVSNAPSKPLSKVAATKAAAQRAASSAANTSTAAANTSITTVGNLSTATAGNTSTLSVSTLVAALPQPQPMLTAGAPVYPRTPTPPSSGSQTHTAQSLPPISTPSNDPGFKPMSSFTSDASPMDGNTSLGMKRQRTETNGVGNVTAPVGGKKPRKTLVDTEPFSTALEDKLKELHEDIKTCELFIYSFCLESD
ncbi:hypothetical protein BN14_04199 [Rhizoctonia solani AG-1 IB]|uniref:Uncharacterized protein n=1 Tax=Thanatephorus cucumeris (strain AG1-IB / isolate 7/3/14) TaxID=1108050 RepID=M5BUL2_THACB|nr:hypothetical protein BN14_04199 [Rhizoctonia solani AG-1 IB]